VQAQGHPAAHIGATSTSWTIVVRLEVADLAEQKLQQEVLKLRRRIEKRAVLQSPT